MTDFVLFTDSTADLPVEMLRSLRAEVLPMEFILDGKAYHNYPDNRDLSPKDFYDALRRGGMSTTNAINSAQMIEVFTPWLQKGMDVLYIVFAGGLSSTFQNARLAAEELEEKFPGRRVYTVDSRDATTGEGFVVWLAGHLREKGLSAGQIADFINENILSVNTWFTVDDLMFLRRGGRLSGGVAIAGTLLGIKPVLHVDDDGHLVAMSKVRSRKGSLDALAQHYAAHALEQDEYPVFISHGDCLQDAEYLAAKCREAGAREVFLGPIGPVIGAHSGPGTIAMTFWGNGR